MEDKLERTMAEYLNPVVMREKLISASIYIATFEALKKSIVSKIRFYYCLDDLKPCELYDKEVMSRNKSPVYASLDWLKEYEAITDADINNFEKIKNCRNELSHNLFNLLGSRGLPQNFQTNFCELAELLHKIDIWWVINIEIPANPDFFGQEIDEAEIKVGSVLALKMLVDIALGEDDIANSY